MPKKRNPQDTTLRNIRALKKRVDKLEGTTDRLNSALRNLSISLAEMSRAVRQFAN